MPVFTPSLNYNLEVCMPNFEPKIATQENLEILSDASVKAAEDDAEKNVCCRIKVGNAVRSYYCASEEDCQSKAQTLGGVVVGPC